ncbi:MAG: GNAT family N-acetyltransferase [Oscillospiraceae bacterium]|nr:GNAT family N-acetyltransferase [Oscillospiraceae bacterium]
MTIRRADSRDIDKTMKLLGEVLELHAALRPDIFISGTTKYTRGELQAIFDNDQTPVFAAIDGSGEMVGYAFCVMKRQPFSTNMHDFSTLYIDDLCVDENCRGQHVGTLLFEHVKQYAKEQGCHDVTLNVWEGNDNARRFYEKMGMFVKETQMEIILDK